MKKQTSSLSSSLSSSSSSSLWCCSYKQIIQPLLRKGLLMPLQIIFLYICVFSNKQDSFTFALFEDEVGMFDSKIETTGHGPVRYVSTATETSSDNNDDSSSGIIIITSDSGPTSTLSPVADYGKDNLSKSTSILSSSSCYLAARHSNTGKLLWRRYVCSKRSSNSSTAKVIGGTNQHHLTLAVPSKNRIITLDTVSAIVRCWDAKNGSMIWENNAILRNTNDIKKKSIPQQIWISNKDPSYVVVGGENNNDSMNVAFYIDTGVKSTQSMGSAPRMGGANSIAPLTTATCDIDSGRNKFSIDIIQNGRQLSVRTVDKNNNHSKDENIHLLSTIPVLDEIMVESDRILSVHMIQCNTKMIHILIATQKGVTASIVLSVATSTGSNLVVSSSKLQWITEESLGQIGSALLLSSGPAISVTTETTTSTTTSIGNPYELLNFHSRLRLQYESSISLVSHLFGQPTFSSNTNYIPSTNVFNYDNFGLTKIAVVLTPYKLLAINASTKRTNQNPVRYQIDLPYDSVGSSGNSNTATTTNWRHQIIHGSVNTPHGTHGINGGAHSREVLVLSRRRRSEDTTEEIKYVCVDGTNGSIHARGNVELSSSDGNSSKKIVQIIPVSGGSTDNSNINYNAATKCRQDALLVFDDNSIVSVLDPNVTSDLIRRYSFSQQLLMEQGTDTTTGSLPQQSPHNGLFAHILDREKSQLTSIAIQAVNNNAAKSYVIGSSTFPNEKILHVAYPNREEVVQSPCNVLGDESLLLKYLNPHLMVVVTARVEDTKTFLLKKNKISNDDDERRSAEERKLVAVALASKGDDGTGGNSKKKGKKRKPLGVTSEQDATAATTISTAAATIDDVAANAVPNLFINVIDSVSGRIVYRVSHTHASIPSLLSSGSGDVTNTVYVPINVLISENWIYYTFVNKRTRRTEMGVLSMYEGMIDPKGLTALTSYETIASSTFSSFDARETKPVVLAKTYTIPKAITALGISSSRGGISNRRLLLATNDGQIHSIDRKMVEPRRPVGPLKDSEKKEALAQYNELLPTIPLLTISYNQSIEDVSTIISAPTDLESQTILMAFGGPDIYFARISPSRGFDLLPDSFNKPLLTLTVVALTVIVVVVQRMAAKKMVKHGWS